MASLLFLKTKSLVFIFYSHMTFPLICHVHGRQWEKVMAVNIKTHEQRWDNNAGLWIWSRTGHRNQNKKKHHNGEICLSLKESFVTEIKMSCLEFVIVISSLLLRIAEQNGFSNEKKR